MPATIEAVFVDLYGTLVHQAQVSPFLDLVGAGLDVDPQTWAAAYERTAPLSLTGRVMTMTDRVLAACTELDLTVRRPAVERIVSRYLPFHAAAIGLDADAKALLHDLQARGLRIALVANASSYDAALLDRFELLPLLDVVVLSCVVGVTTPDPAIYCRALSDLGVEAPAAAFVGAGERDELGGARRLGLRTVLVDRRLPHSAAAGADADARVAALREVVPALTWLGAS